MPLALGCGQNKVPDVEPGMMKVKYQASDKNFANPERGFYMAMEVYRADGTGIADASLNANRLQGRSLVLLEFHLKDYVACDISEDYLEMIRLKFQALRRGGNKCVLRFCYSNGFAESDKPWDAPIDQVLRHIEQLRPLLQEYYDVIMVVQAGFVGSWGEWYYTQNYTEDAPRKQLVDALLDAVPAERQIELRTPAFKMNLYGHSLADTLTRAEAHLHTEKARLGGHNDCYLKTSNDNGTFNGAGERAYWAAETLYTIMGGETCGWSAYCNCEPQPDFANAHGVLADMAIYHFTYLNINYDRDVLKKWKSQGCFEEIEKRLGYRYILESGQFTKAPAAGEPFRIILKIRNDGFAPAQNPRDAYLVLTDPNGEVVKTWPLNSDPRFWMPGEITSIDQTISLPENISGKMTLHLNLPDPCDNLCTNPLFSIRLANEDVWDENTGYNMLTSFSL